MTQGLSAALRADSAPRWVGANVKKVLEARGNPERLTQLFQSSPVPMVMVDGQRRYVDVNVPARLAFRVPLAELQMMRIENLTPRELLPTMEAAWAQLMTDGCASGPYSVASPDGTSLEIIYYGLAHALPGLHLIAFAPAGWPEEEFLSASQQRAINGNPPLTAREIEVLQLAAEGMSAPRIASELHVSVATVRTHFGHIYAKLDVGDRAGAVAKAMRHGLIH
jgi:DNA-binding NarL/FixJ family response regulator